MKKPRSPHPAQAFTLIELLVVISIIAVLASLTIAATQSAMLAAKKVTAKNDMMQLANAVTCYYTEYGKYPCGSATSPTTDIVYGMGNANSLIVNVLRYPTTGSWTDTNSENPRQIKFLQPKVLNASSDLITKAAVNQTSGNWMDPWGFQYLLFEDLDYDDTITVYPAFTDIPATNNPAFGVGTACIGYYQRVKLKDTTDTALPTAVTYSSNKQSILLSWQ